MEHVETGAEVLQITSNFERLKKYCLRNGNTESPKDKTMNGSVEDEVNETNMGEKEVGHCKDFNGSSITLPITFQMVAKKNSEGR